MVVPELRGQKLEFFDRKSEIDLLNKIREESRTSARFTMMKGRRRIGKTTLLQHAYGDEDFLYFFVARKNESDLCADFQLEVERFFKMPMPGQVKTFEGLFKYLLEVSKQRYFTLVIDEFQEFLRVNPSIFSAMQRDWDLNKNAAKINLIVNRLEFRAPEICGIPAGGKSVCEIRANVSRLVLGGHEWPCRSVEMEKERTRMFKPCRKVERVEYVVREASTSSTLLHGKIRAICNCLIAKSKRIIIPVKNNTAEE